MQNELFNNKRIIVQHRQIRYTVPELVLYEGNAKGFVLDYHKFHRSID